MIETLRAHGLELIPMLVDAVLFSRKALQRTKAVFFMPKKSALDHMWMLHCDCCKVAMIGDCLIEQRWLRDITDSSNSITVVH